MPMTAADNQESFAGDKLYFFRSPRATTECIIMAHGGVELGTQKFQAPINIHFFTRHGETLKNPSPLEHLMTKKHRPPEDVPAGGQCTNYTLSKVVGRHLPSQQFSYSEIAMWMDDSNFMCNRGAMDRLGQTRWCPHVVTVRHRWYNKQMKLQEAIDHIREHEPTIADIHVMACRAVFFNGKLLGDAS
jgi:hypothetical protein